ncbi:MAG TPA: hypothetical protein PKA09_02820 [Geminicoccus sp.]|nr:hypothetical protein [Geminicoccus sp.]
MPEPGQVAAIAPPPAAGRAVAGETVSRPAAARLVAGGVVALVVGPEGDLTVVEAGGRLLGIEGLAPVPPGSRLRMVLPAGFPSIGGTVEVRIWSGEEAAEPPTPHPARLVTPQGGSWPAELRRTQDGHGLAARILGYADAPALPARMVPAGTESRLIEAEIVDLAADGSARLATPGGELLMSTAMPGLLPGRRLKLLLVGDSAGSQPAAGHADHAGGPPARDAAVGLAALLARFSARDAGSGEPAAAHGARERPAPGPGEALRPAADVGADLDWVLIPERLSWGDDLADVLLARGRERDAAGSADRTCRRMLLALSLSQLGDVQLDLGFDEGGIDLAVRTAGPPDADTAHEIRAALASIAAVGTGFRGRLVERLLAVPGRSPGHDVVA